MTDSVIAGNFKKKTMKSRDDIFRDLLNYTYTGLNPQQVIIAFISDIRKSILLGGIKYSEDRLSLNYTDGEMAQHHYAYNLKFRGMELGNLCFSTKNPLLKREIITLENKLAGLVMPLFHAIAYQQAFAEADRDELTGLMNSTACHKSIDISIDRAIDEQRSFSLLEINVDDFKGINLNYGRAAGDALLIEVVARIKNELQDDDVVFRVDADEFIVIISNIVKYDALVIAEEIKQSVISKPCTHDGKEIVFTVSIGVVTDHPFDDAFSLMARADKALSHAKSLGKNRIQLCSFADPKYHDIKKPSLSPGLLEGRKAVEEMHHDI